MKVHCINILLFAVLLNILVYNQRNHKSTTPRHTTVTRLLCECELYAPANYDNDPQMKEVMDNFNKQTQERFHEYDDRMKTIRQKCKDKCDKEIQKIILKDKLEKELMDKFATLDTDIQNDAIPTCICEKSMEEKVEKGCLRCAQNFGGIVVPSAGVIGEIAAFSLSAWKTTALEAATKYAMAQGALKGAAAGIKEGMRVVIGALEERGVRDFCPKLLQSIGDTIPYNDAGEIGNIILENLTRKCGAGAPSGSGVVCTDIRNKLGIILSGKGQTPPDNIYISKMMKVIVGKAEEAADIKAGEVTSATYNNIMTKQTALIEGGFNSSTASIYVSVIAIVIIVLIMVIIYLILRYRRKKKMKKKLQYIKLLEE